MSGQLENFVTNVAGVGRFQIALIIEMYVIKAVSAWGMMVMSFAGYDPGWECETWGINDTQALNMSELRVHGITESPGNQTYHVYQDMFLPNASIEEKCELANSCPRIMFTPGTSTIVTEWTLICDKTWILSFIISLQMGGVAIGSYIGGYVGDKCGRKVAMYLMLILSAVSNCIAVFSVSWEMFAVVRIFIGIGVGGIITLVHILPLEFLTKNWRVIYLGTPGWYIATAIFGVLILLVKNWKHVHIATAVLAIIVIVSMYWLPESMRWLALNGKADKAKAVAQRVCKYNRRPCPADHVLDFSKSGMGENTEKPDFKLLFKKSLLRKTISGTIVKFLLSSVFYGVGFGVKSLFGNFYINFIVYSLLFIPVAPIIPVLGNKLGRRWGSVILVGMGGILSFGVVIVSLTTDGPLSHAAITGLALISTVCVGSGWAVVAAFFVEHLPTSVRSLGYGFMLVGARIGGILAPFFIPQDQSDLYIVYLIMGGMIMVSCALILSLPETSDIVMAETTSEIKMKGKDINSNSSRELSKPALPQN